jgi:hypothetical protein
LDREDISILVILNLNVLIVGSTRSVNTTTPTPPIKWVDDLQKIRPFGRASISLRIVAPVVVKPDTDSNRAFASVNSPPHKRYGSIPKIHERSQANIVIAKPSEILISSAVRTKIKGKHPTINVMNPLIRRGVKEESIPLKIETTIESNINIPLNINVAPRYLDISFIFIAFS